MIEKYYYLDRKYTMWERQHLVLKRETQEEIDTYIENIELSDINFNLGGIEGFDEIDVVSLYETMEVLPLAENGYQPTLELLDRDSYETIKDNLQDINKEDVKMFSINDISDIWNSVYDEHFIEQYEGFYKELLKNIGCLLYTSPSPRDRQKSRMPSSA